MATAGQTITNNVTGDKLKWLKTGTDTNGNLLQGISWTSFNCSENHENNFIPHW